MKSYLFSTVLALSVFIRVHIRCTDKCGLTYTQLEYESVRSAFAREVEGPEYVDDLFLKPPSGETNAHKTMF